MAVTYLISEFRDKEPVAAAIKELRSAGVSDRDLDVFSEEPIEFRRGVLDRPSNMSLAAVLGAAIFGIGATALVALAQYNYAVNTGGMPTFSAWGTGVISYETTMMGAVFSTFGYFLWESGIIRKRDKTAPVPVVPPESICLRVRCLSGTAKSIAILRNSGALDVQEKGVGMKWLAAVGVLAALVCCLNAADQKPLPWEKNHILIGQTLYRANCVVCHDVDRPQAESKKFGPSFYQLFRRDKMPLANMKPNRDYIKLRIKFGGAIMPAFAKKLNDNEIDTLLDFLQSK